MPCLSSIAACCKAIRTSSVLLNGTATCIATCWRLAAPVLTVPGGESIKNDWHHVADIHRVIHRGGLCRHSYVVGVGGGAVLDVVGFAAATAHRGIRLIRIPTTVLAQDDSAVGVKNGINAYGKKNFLGTFAPPHAVINDSRFLPTLHDRDWRGGISEAIKAALIRDPGFFDFIERPCRRLEGPRPVGDGGGRPAIGGAAPRAHRAGRRSVRAGLLASPRLRALGRSQAGSADRVPPAARRGGRRSALALDTTYAHLSGALGEHEWRRVIDVIQAVGLAIHAPELDAHLDDAEDPRGVLSGLNEFREHLGGELTILLLSGIGRPFDCHDIDTSVMVRSIEVLRRMSAAGAPRE